MRRSRAAIAGLGALALMALLCGGCGRRNGSGTAGSSSLIGGEFTEKRLAETLDSVGALTIDFTTRPDLQGIFFGNLLYELSDRGLLVRPTGNDPNIVFDRADLRFNQIEITLQAEVGGKLELFWARRGAAFSEERKRTVPLEPSLKPQTYTVDLWDSLDLAQGEYQFRIDPIDRQADVRVLSVAFHRLGLRAQDSARAYRIGKVIVEGETRESIALPVGGHFDRTLALPARGKLLFGLTRSRSLGTPMTLVVRGAVAGGSPQSLFEKTLDDASPVSWRDYQVEIPAALAGATAQLTFEARSAAGPPGSPAPQAGALAGALLCSHPVVVPDAPVPGQRPNILLISLDTVGARPLGLGENAPGKAPFLWHLAREGARFEKAFSHSSLTNISHASLLTGLLPLPASFNGEVKERTTLASILRANGYQTAALTGGVRVIESLGFDQGFDSFFQADTLYKEPIGARTDVRDILARARAWIEPHRSAPFFLFLHTYEAHGPYWEEPPPGAPAAAGGTPAFFLSHMRGRDRISREELGHYVSIAKTTDLEARPIGPGDAALATLERARQAYLSEISRLDTALRGFFAWLEEQSLTADTVVVLTADHGEAFYEHGLLEHGLLYDENLHVPLLVVFPRRVPKGVVVRQQVGSADIVPTLLDLAGIHTRLTFDGRPLLGDKGAANAPAGRHYAWVPDNGFTWRLDGRYALLLRTAYPQENFGKTELFDLPVDPGENHNLLEEGKTGPAIRPRFDRLVRETVRQLPGTHLLFEGLGGRQLKLEIGVAGDRAAGLYLFDVERLGPPVALSGPSLKRRLRFGARPELVVVDRQLPVPLSIRLAEPAGETAASFAIDTGDVGPKPIRKKLPALGATVTIWRVSPTASAPGASGLTREEEDGLRSLGYVQH